MAGIIFPYFRDPHNFSNYVETPQECGVCGRERPGYDGAFYGEDDLDFICEPCLATGELAHLGFTTNQADRHTLYWQLKVAHPNLEEAEIEPIVQEKASTVEERTPSVITWQDFEWPAHCQDYACFLKEAGKADFNALAPDGDGRMFAREHLYHDTKSDLEDIWDTIRPDSPTNLAESYNTAVYLFQCLHCGEYIILWDCN